MSDRRFNGESGEISKFDYQWTQSWEFKTEVSQTIGGYEQRRARWLRPLRLYSLPMNNKTLAKANTLRQFFYDHQGQAESFLFYDPSSKNRWTIPENSIAYGSATKVFGYWTDVCYNTTVNKFISTGVYQQAAYSNDGVNWASATLPDVATYWTVCNGDFYTIAVGYGSTHSARTTNGIRWYRAPGMPYLASWTAVAYGSSTFVSVGTEGAAAYLPEGSDTWYESVLSSSYNWSDVCYGSGTFVAVCSSPLQGRISYSTDRGATWSSSTVTSGTWTSVAYGSGTFVAVGNTNGKVITSSDGVNWASATIPTTETLLGLSYGDEKFVALVYQSDRILYSTTGTVWASATLPAALDWRVTTHGGGKFVAMPFRTIDNKQTNINSISDDGITWTYDPKYPMKIYLSSQNIYPLDSTPTFGENGDIRVWVSGTERTTNMTINQQEGSITFTSSYPDAGQDIEVEYSHYVRVRFNSDIVEVSEQRYNLESMTVELKEVR